MITDLEEALKQDLNTTPLVTNEILDMFKAISDTGNDRAMERFNKARKLYQNIINNPNFDSAFFYRLEVSVRRSAYLTD